jgi:leader peptidase (prepilin peptidase)/N-methyltransferase
VIKILVYIIVLSYGLIIGSFLNVCVYRIPLSQSIIYPPSNCTACNTRLKWKDLIPLFSYLILKGRCRYCGEKISLRYPLQEILTSLLFLTLYVNFGFSIYFLKYVILFSFLIVISSIDIKYQDVYVSNTFPGIITGVIFAIIESFLYSSSFWNYFFGAVIAGAVIFLIVFITGAMGAGDIEIAVLCGVFIGWKYSIIMIILSFIIGGIVGILLIATRKKGRKDYIAFGPFLALATLMVIFFGKWILNYYFGLFV